MLDDKSLCRRRYQIVGKMTEKRDIRKNNFNIIRMAACLFVFVGHMGRILGVEPPVFSGYVLHEMGVAILFMLAGYLVTESWLKDPNLLRYGIRRFFRLWPPFAVMVLIMTFIAGPLVSDLGVSGYFQSWYSAYLNNLRLYITYSLPGVFTDLPVANTVNGSLWTMPVEAAMYVISPLIAVMLHMRRRSERSFIAAIVLTAIILILDLYFIAFMRGTQIVIYHTDLISAHHLALSYITGALFTYPQMKKILNIQWACAGMGILLLLARAPAPLLYLFMDLFVPYFIFSFALVKEPAFHQFGRKADLSYGIYLYGFFFQQLTMQHMSRNDISASYISVLIISFLPTFLAAIVSYFLVEKPLQQFTRAIITRFS